MKTFAIAPAKSKPLSSVLDETDVAARYLVYKLYDSTRGHLGAEWQELTGIGERPETVSRAVERGWVIVREHNGKSNSAALTEDGRRVGRKGAR